MNNLNRLKKMAGFAMIAIFLILGSNDLIGQVKLKKNIGGGGPEPSIFMDALYQNQVNELLINCLEEEENQFEFNFEFNSDLENIVLKITQLEITYNSTSLLINESFPVQLSNNSEQNFIMEHDNIWGSLSSSCPEFNLTIEYRFIDRSNPSNVIYGDLTTEQYNFQIPICGVLCSEMHGEKDSHTNNEEDSNTGAEDEGNNQYRINQNMIESSILPNPSNGNFLINYTLENDETVDITLFNSTGKVISIITNQEQTKGKYTLECNELDKHPNGIYYICITTGDSKHTQKIIKL